MLLQAAGRRRRRPRLCNLDRGDERYRAAKKYNLNRGYVPAYQVTVTYTRGGFVTLI